MQREEFLDYLQNVVGLKLSTSRSRAANCSTIEDYEGDLDLAYSQDGMRSLMDRLSYSKADERAGRPARHYIPIDGNIYNGTATLRSAANLYLSFKRGEIRKAKETNSATEETDARAFTPNRRGRTKQSRDWPIWEQPSVEDSWLVAQVAMRFVKFLDPRIVESIVKDNYIHRDEWSESLSVCGVDPTLYLWDGSPCAFPGVRRHAGSQEINRLRDSSDDYSEVPDTICLDDNDYPKQVWSFVFRNARFSKFGPEGYRLAHLVDHKAHKNRMAEELAAKPGAAVRVTPGLYTCPSNTAYICGSLILPTDFNPLVRNLLVRKAQELYGCCCSMFPPGLSVPPASEPGWETSDFEWSECVGTLDFIDSFIDFRKQRMAKLISKAQS